MVIKPIRFFILRNISRFLGYNGFDILDGLVDNGLRVGFPAG
jgi:hypothetical protein